MDVTQSEVELFGSAYVALDDIRLRLIALFIRNPRTRHVRMGAEIPQALGSADLSDQGGQSFEQDELCFDLKSRRGLSRQAVTVQGEAVFHAEVAKRQADERIHVAMPNSLRATPKNPHFHFHLKRAVMIPGEKVVSGPFYLKFRKILRRLRCLSGGFQHLLRNGATGS